MQAIAASALIAACHVEVTSPEIWTDSVEHLRYLTTVLDAAARTYRLASVMRSLLNDVLLELSFSTSIN